MTLTGTIGERITALRIENRMSQKDLADFLYVNQATISRWEKGIRYPDDDLIVKMARRFGVNPSVLLDPMPFVPTVILVDDEEISLEVNIPMMRKYLPDAELRGFSNSRDALEYAEQKKIDAAFLDIDLFLESGLDLAKQLEDLYPNINIVFLTGHPEFMHEAFMMHASGYILKPMMPADFAHEINNLRYPVEGLSVSLSTV